MLRFYNTMTRRKEIFKPLKNDYVRIYSCGPTVYDFAHIGNFRAFIFYDILRRYLKYKGYKVKHVINITDVDDKTIKGSQRLGISLKEYTEKYTKAFFEDLDRLNIERVEVNPKATEHIEDMVNLIKILIKKGYAYRGEDGSIYYDVSRFKDYGKLSGIKLKELKAGARVKQDEYGKGEARDFALWKAYTKEDGDVYWETEIGKGRPGWHIECSAMSMRYLGETLDIHTGGIDLIFPHHENEIAQSEAATGKTFVRYWMHNDFVLINGKKMSKSLGNFFTLRDLLEKGHDAMAIRYLLLSTHYRSKLNITEEALTYAKNSVDKIMNFIDTLDEIIKSKQDVKNGAEVMQLIKKTEKGFESAMDDDLNTSLALSYIFDFIKGINRLIEKGKLSSSDAERCKALMLKFDKVLGIIERKMKEGEHSAGRKLLAFQKTLRGMIGDEKLLREFDARIKKVKGYGDAITNILWLREEFRKRKQFEISDKIRAEMLKIGIVIEDTPAGQKWKIRR